MADAPIKIHSFTAPQVVEFLRVMAKQMGGVAEFAKRIGYDRANLDKIIKGKRRPTARLLAKLNIHEERYYVWTATAQSVKTDAEGMRNLAETSKKSPSTLIENRKPGG